MEQVPPTVWVIYDGNCPFCRHFVLYARLRDAASGRLELVDMRGNDGVLQKLDVGQYNLNEGMLVKIGEAFYHGGDAIHILSLMTTGSGLFNKLVRLIGRNRQISRLLYPLLRWGRNFSLVCMGVCQRLVR